MNKRFLIPFFVLGGIITSCTTMRSFSVDQMLPADISLPPQIRKVAIVNNLPSPPYRWPENYSWQDMDKSIEGDGKLMAENLAQQVADGNFFDQIVICDSALRKNDPSRRTSPLTQHEVKKLSEELGADMIVSVDAILIKATPSQVYSIEDGAPKGIIDAQVATVSRVYIPSRKEPLTTLNDRDTIFWYASYVYQDEIVKNGSECAATLPIKHLIPTWKAVTRYYYAGGGVDLRDAEVSMKEGSWDSALAAWKRIYNSQNKKKQKYAAFNMALYYELQENFDEAEKWIKTAMGLVSDSDKIRYNESVEYQIMQTYLAELEKRNTETQKLKLQMNRFQDDF